MSKNIKHWLEERDRVLRTHDVNEFKKFYEKWRRNGVYKLPLPKNDLIIRASMEKGILAMADATEQEIESAKIWLIGHGFKPEF